MAYIPDLSPCEYFGAAHSSGLVAVGWLEKGHEFTKADVDAEFTAKLVEIAKDPWQPVHFAGPHACEFCRISKIGGVANLFVPAEGFLYVAPSLIVHYVDAHEYAPPAAFQRAVVACPRMRSMEYLKAILKNGPKGLIASGGRHG